MGHRCCLTSGCGCREGFLEEEGRLLPGESVALPEPPALFQTWTGTHRAGVQPSQGGVGAAQGASESGAREAVALLIYEPADPWPSVGLEEEGPNTALPADVFPAALECGERLPAYLPQEEWVPASPARLAPPQSEGSSCSDYCALGCYGGCHPPPFPGNMPGSGPICASACGLSCDQQSLAARPGGSSVGAGLGQGPDLREQAACGPQGVSVSHPRQTVGAVLKGPEPDSASCIVSTLGKMD